MSSIPTRTAQPGKPPAAARAGRLFAALRPAGARPRRARRIDYVDRHHRRRDQFGDRQPARLRQRRRAATRSSPAATSTASTWRRRWTCSRIAMADLGSISERRLARLVDPTMSYGLPRNLLAGKRGLNTGFATVQCSMSALVMENRTLSMPGSVDSIPGQVERRGSRFQFHLVRAQGAHHRRKRRADRRRRNPDGAQALTLVEDVAKDHPVGAGTRAALDAVRKVIAPALSGDRWYAIEMGQALDLVRSGAIVAAVEVGCRRAGLKTVSRVGENKMARVNIEGLQVDSELHAFVENEALPGSGVSSQAFWAGYAAMVRDLSPAQHSAARRARPSAGADRQMASRARRPAARRRRIRRLPARDRLSRARARRLDDLDRERRRRDRPHRRPAACRAFIERPLRAERGQRALGLALRRALRHGRDLRGRRRRARRAATIPCAARR